jgi:hypothetical protein
LDENKFHYAWVKIEDVLFKMRKPSEDAGY